MTLKKFISNLVHGKNPDSDASIIDPASRASATDTRSPRNVLETKIWQNSVGAISKFWANYQNLLSLSFKRMPREMQEQLISRICMIITIGVATILIMFFYPFIPQYIRIPLVPISIIGSYWLANRVVSPVMLSRYEHILNRRQ